MIDFYSGAALFLAGSIGFAIWRHKSNDHSLDALVNSLRPISPDGNIALGEATSQPYPEVLLESQLSWHDARSIFYNSRHYVRIANRARLCDPTDLDMQICFEEIQEDHRRLRWIFVALCFEKLLFKLTRVGLPLYARLLLWTYCEQLQFLKVLSARCGPTEREAIQKAL